MFFSINLEKKVLSVYVISKVVLNEDLKSYGILKFQASALHRRFD